MKQFTFGKEERLSHRNQIDELFTEGRTFNVSPFKVIYKVVDADTHPRIKIMVAVPKKKFKRAVDRNRLKRLIRESYRLNKNLLPEMIMTSTIGLHIGFIYIGDNSDILYIEMEKPMIGCLQRLGNIINNRNGECT
jgi:ribonuclease P protein component